MKLTIKTLQQSTFTVETEPNKTVKELKSQIEKEHGKDYPSGAQKLIYSGKILADESKLSEYNIDEKKFIVLMITRPPPAPKPAAVSEKAGASSSSSSSSSIKTEPETAARAAAAKQTDDKSNTKSNTSSSTVSAPTTTPAATRSSARLSSSTNPPPTAAAPATTTTTAPSPLSNNEASILSAMSEPQLATRLAMLMSQPQFRQIQDHIQQSPHLLSQTIESLAASDPEMYNFISENPDVFVNALNHPPMAGLRPQGTRPGEHGRPSSQAGQGPGMEQLIGNVSEHDKEAIERLKELGFSEYLAVQAYMACDKDEQLAANLLFQMDQ